MQSRRLIIQGWDEVRTEEAADLFIIDGIVSSRSTLIYGEPKAGKSLVASGLVSSLATGEPFLGREVQQPAGGWRPLVCWTDDGGASEYKTRIAALHGDRDPGIRFAGLPPALGAADWAELAEHVRATGRNVIVFDVLSQIINGELNSGADVAVVLNGIRQFTRANIPVVMIAHSSEKSGPGGKPDKPLGHTSISGGFRWRVMLSRSRTGVWALRADGNRGDEHSITFTAPDTFDVPAFRLESAKDGGQLRSEAQRNRRKRSEDKMAKGAEIARFLQGKNLSQRKAGKVIAEEFGGSADHHKNQLGKNAYPVRRDASGMWEVTQQAA